MERLETRAEVEHREMERWLRMPLDGRYGTVVIGDPGLVEMRRPPAMQGRRLLALEEVLYSIRVPEVAGEVECACCGLRFLAAGPTGHADDDPICDLCLLVASEELGMVLALVAVVRAFAAPLYERGEDYWDALAEVGAFGRIYERIAARSGPPRLILNNIYRPF